MTVAGGSCAAFAGVRFVGSVTSMKVAACHIPISGFNPKP